MQRNSFKVKIIIITFCKYKCNFRDYLPKSISIEWIKYSSIKKKKNFKEKLSKLVSS